MRPDRNRRVVESHTLARAAFRLAGVFGAVAAGWAIAVLVRGGSWWGPLHSFLAGSVFLAISGASQMFTITWAAAPAPPGRTTSLQRWTAAVGVAGILLGVASGIEWLVWLAGSLVVASLGLLGWSIASAVRASLLRRFDLSSRFYLTAFATAMVGVALGMVLGSGRAGDAYPTIRLVHAHLNLAGFVGLTIVGTLPTFLPTVAHHRAVSGREASVAWWASSLGVLTMAGALTGQHWLVGAGTLLVGAGASLVLGGIVLRLWAKGRNRSPFLQITAGTLWLIAWAAVDGVSLLVGGAAMHFAPWTGAVVLAGIGQVLAGSLGYLLPVLAGPPLSENSQRMTHRPWLPLVCANLAGAALPTGLTEVAIVLAAIWVGDFAARIVRLRSSSAGDIGP